MFVTLYIPTHRPDNSLGCDINWSQKWDSVKYTGYECLGGGSRKTVKTARR